MPNGGGVAEESGRGWSLAGSTPLSPGRTPLSPRAKTNDNGPGRHDYYGCRHGSDSGGRSGCSSRVNGGSSCRGFRCIDSSGSSPPRIGRGRFCSADGGRLAGERPRRIPGWLSDASDTSDVGCDIRSDAGLDMSTEGVSDEAEWAPGDD
eukprot:g16297.t1